MGFDDIADDVGVDPEILVDEDTSKTSDLRPGDARVHVRDLCWQMVYGFADDL